MSKGTILIIIFILLGGCTVIKNHGVLNYTPASDTKLIDWHPNKHPGYSIFNKQDSIPNDTLQ